MRNLKTHLIPFCIAVERFLCLLDFVLNKLEDLYLMMSTLLVVMIILGNDNLHFPHVAILIIITMCVGAHVHSLQPSSIN